MPQRRRTEVDALTLLLQNLAKWLKQTVDALQSVIAQLTVLNTGSTETHKTDNAAFAQDTDKVDMAGFILDEAAGTALTENDAAAARIDDKRAQVVVLEDATVRGRRVTITAAGEILVAGSGGGGGLLADTELPAAALLSDALANPTTPLVGACLLQWGGATWSRVGPGNPLVIDGAVDVDNIVGGTLGVLEGGPVAHDSPWGSFNKPHMIGGYADDTAPANVSADGDAVRAWFLRNGAQAQAIVSDAGLIAGVVDETGASAVDAAAVGGGTPHDSVDSGNPVKIGSKAVDYKPDSSGEQGATAVAAADRAQAAVNLRGENVECVKAEYVALTDLDITYDDSPTTATSAEIVCWQYRMATFSLKIDATVSSSHTLTVTVEQSPVDTGDVWFPMMNGPLASWFYDDAVATNQIARSLTFPIACQRIRVKLTGANTTASFSFAVDDSYIYLRN